MAEEIQATTAKAPLVKVDLGDPVIMDITFPDTAIMTRAEAERKKYPIIGEATPEEAEQFQHPVPEKSVSK